MPLPTPARFGIKASYQQRTVGIAPVRLDVPLGNRTGVIIRNRDNAAILYIGFDANVNIATGWPIDPNGKEELDFGPGIPIYGIRDPAAANDIDSRILEAV